MALCHLPAVRQCVSFLLLILEMKINLPVLFSVLWRSNEMIIFFVLGVHSLTTSLLYLIPLMQMTIVVVVICICPF